MFPIFFIKSKAENQLKFKQNSVHAVLSHRARNIIKLLCRETPGFIIPNNLCLFNISDFVLWITES